MLNALADSWWVLVVRGTLALIFGLLALLWPEVTLAALVALFGAYAIVDGLAAAWVALTSSRGRPGHWWLLAQGALSVAAGVVVFAWPGITALALVFVIGFWAVATGVTQIVAAVVLRRELAGEWVQMLGGAIAILFGVAVIVRPGEGALAIAWLIGLWSLSFGVLLIVLGVRARGLRDRWRLHPA